MRYELSDETIEVDNIVLHRVRYIGIRGLGGYIESEKNLSQEGGARVLGNARVSGYAYISGNACILGDARISDNACILGNARISGNAQVSGKAVIHGFSEICSGLWKTTPLQIHGSRFFFNMTGDNLIAVGCHTYTPEKWRDIYNEKFKEHHFTNEEQIEYILYFNLASTLYGFGFKLPLPGDESEKEAVQTEGRI
jgi:carbonic anhydrase/acetyltransferase-like protein (isoleucine patch superfamily)